MNYAWEQRAHENNAALAIKTNHYSFCLLRTQIDATKLEY